VPVIAGVTHVMNVQFDTSGDASAVDALHGSVTSPVRTRRDNVTVNDSGDVTPKSVPTILSVSPPAVATRRGVTADTDGAMYDTLACVC
jgi:hypothetical protein